MALRAVLAAATLALASGRMIPSVTLKSRVTESAEASSLVQLRTEISALNKATVNGKMSRGRLNAAKEFLSRFSSAKAEVAYPPWEVALDYANSTNGLSAEEVAALNKVKEAKRHSGEYGGTTDKMGCGLYCSQVYDMCLNETTPYYNYRMNLVAYCFNAKDHCCRCEEHTNADISGMCEGTSRAIPVDCATSDWSDWSPCSVSCGPGGSQTRSRAIIVEADNKGKVCPDTKETQECNPASCDSLPEHCSAEHTFGEWSTCSANCGGGITTRAAVVEDDCPSFGESKECNPDQCIIKHDVYTWGCNDAGQLGHGDTENRKSPELVTRLQNYQFTYKATPGSEGRVITKDVTKFVMGPKVASAITTSGDVFMWGKTKGGMLGIGKGSWVGEQKSAPAWVQGKLRLGQNVTLTAISEYVSAAVTVTGDLYMWGTSTTGQLATRDKQDDSLWEPVCVSCLTKALEHNVRTVSLGYEHACAITRDNKLYCWGSNGYGEMGNGKPGTNSAIPRLVQGTPGFVQGKVAQVSCAKYFTAAITMGGDLYTWGKADQGGLGHGEGLAQYNDLYKTKPIQATPMEVLSFDKKTVMEVACARLGTICAAITDDGKGSRDLYTWGIGETNALGHGDDEDRPTPYEVSALNGINVKQVAVSWQHMIALTESGDVYTWGSGECGKLGHGDEVDQLTPRMLQGGSMDFIQVTAGAASSGALARPVFKYKADPTHVAIIAGDLTPSDPTDNDHGAVEHDEDVDDDMLGSENNALYDATSRGANGGGGGLPDQDPGDEPTSTAGDNHDDNPGALGEGAAVSETERAGGNQPGRKARKSKASRK